MVSLAIARTAYIVSLGSLALNAVKVETSCSRLSSATVNVSASHLQRLINKSIPFS
jgi:hypothetical protein